jgi:two-component system phosphate regulon response regulator PhoB
MSARRILVVEDEKAIRDMIAFGLRRAGYEVREAEDCREARARIVDVRPDLMLVDWMLPDMSGLELTRSLKRAKDTEEIPVIMLTARAEEQDKVNGLEGGADDYITKPFSPRELLARIQAVVRHPRAPMTSWKSKASSSMTPAIGSVPVSGKSPWGPPNTACCISS